MLFFNKTVLLPTIGSLINTLKTQYISPSSIFFYGDRFAIKHFNHNDLNVVRIWKTKSFMDKWYDDFNCDYFIGAIDYKICDDKIKIEYMNINDSNDVLYEKYKFKMNDDDAMKLNTAMIDFVKNIAKENKKPKIVIDVHNNLRIYNKYYNVEGFEITDRKAEGNRFWLEAEMNM